MAHPMSPPERRRRDLGWTLYDMSKKTRISTQFLSLFENGRGIPTEDQARRIAKALGIEPEDLMKPAVDVVVESR